MKINYLKDGLFDLLNDNSEELGRILEREDE